MREKDLSTFSLCFLISVISRTNLTEGDLGNVLHFVIRVAGCRALLLDLQQIAGAKFIQNCGHDVLIALVPALLQVHHNFHALYDAGDGGV